MSEILYVVVRRGLGKELRGRKGWMDGWMERRHRGHDMGRSVVILRERKAGNECGWGRRIDIREGD